MSLTRNLITYSLLLLCNQAFAEGLEYWGKFRREPKVGNHLILAKKMTQPSEKILKKYPADKYMHYTIDLDQDGQNDYIVTKQGEFKTCFVKSDLKVHSCEKLSFELMDGFAYEYFFSVGKNQMLYLLDLSGDESTSEFFIYKFDPKTWKRSRLTAINTLIQVDTKKYKGIYWGYPWDITDLPIKTENGSISIPIVFENGFENEPDGTKGPAFVFTGTPTQGESRGSYSKLKSKIMLVPAQALEARLKSGR